MEDNNEFNEDFSDLIASAAETTEATEALTEDEAFAEKHREHGNGD